MSLLRRLQRILAVGGKEMVEIVRRPTALVSVIAGPVLILGLFGLGYLGQPPLRTEVVIPPGSGLSDDPTAYSTLAADRVTVVGVTSDVAAGRAVLHSGAADILVIAPPTPSSSSRRATRRSSAWSTTRSARIGRSSRGPPPTRSSPRSTAS